MVLPLLMDLLSFVSGIIEHWLYQLSSWLLFDITVITTVVFAVVK